MNRDYKEKLSRKIENHFSNLEMRIMEDIVRRIRQYGKITSTAEWQVNRLVALGNSSEDIEKMLKETLNASYPDMFELYDQVIDWEYVRNKDIFEQINAQFIPYEENEQLQQLADAIRRQTQEELENITRSLGFYLDYGNGKRVLTPLAQVYQGYLDNAIMGVAFGAFDYNSVLRRTVSQLTNSGLRVIDYASGRSYRANVASRTAVMTGISQLTGHISDINAEKLGTEYFEVAWHSGARPTHAEWQGRVWSKKQLYDVCGLGTVTGLLGANCYHEYYPFYPGISERNWSDEWLGEQNRKENTPKEWNGKEYTTYEAKQKQRQMETSMRAQREKVELLKNGEADPDEVMLARCKYQAQLDEYARFSKKMGLKQERERIYLDMKGRIAPSNPKYSNFIKSVEKRESSVTIKKVKDKGIIEVHTIGKIDKNIYRCITEDIVTDEVIITDERIQHIKERHPNDYERYYRYLKKIVEDPDYIMKTNKPNTALILKEIVESEEKQFKTVLRLTTSKDNPEYKNSIITFMKINEKEWSRLIRNKQILYKKE